MSRDRSSSHDDHEENLEVEVVATDDEDGDRSHHTTTNVICSNTNNTVVVGTGTSSSADDNDGGHDQDRNQDSLSEITTKAARPVAGTGGAPAVLERAVATTTTTATLLGGVGCDPNHFAPTRTPATPRAVANHIATTAVPQQKQDSPPPPPRLHHHPVDVDAHTSPADVDAYIRMVSTTSSSSSSSSSFSTDEEQEEEKQEADKHQEPWRRAVAPPVPLSPLAEQLVRRRSRGPRTRAARPNHETALSSTTTTPSTAAARFHDSDDDDKEIGTPTATTRTKSQDFAVNLVLMEAENDADAEIINADSDYNNNPRMTNNSNDHNPRTRPTMNHMTTTAMKTKKNKKAKKSSSASAGALGEEMSSLDPTAALTEDELPAAIPPSLRRHTSSPGAYSAGGNLVGSTCVTTHHGRSSGSRHRQHHRHRQESGRWPAHTREMLVSATLVPPDTPSVLGNESLTDGSASQYLSPHQHQALPNLPLAHAEPLDDGNTYSKRRLALCLGFWVLLLTVSLAVAVTLAFTLSGKIGAQSDSDDDMMPKDFPPSLDSPPPRDDDSIPPNSNTMTPTAPPHLPAVPNEDTRVSYHAINWGRLVYPAEDVVDLVENSTSSASATTAVTTANSDDRRIILKCGGRITVAGTQDAVCTRLPLDEAPDVIDERRVACARNGTTNATLLSSSYATVIFACTGESNADRAATALLPPSGNIVGDAAAWIRLGRYCRDNDDWALWSDRYLCENGQKMVETALGVMTPDEFLEAGGFFRRQRKLRHQRLRKLLILEDLVDSLSDFADIRSFCYSMSNACSAAGNCAAAEVPAVRMSDKDTRTKCRSELDDIPTIERMWELAYNVLDPTSIIDFLDEEIS